MKTVVTRMMSAMRVWLTPNCTAPATMTGESEQSVKAESDGSQQE